MSEQEEHGPSEVNDLLDKLLDDYVSEQIGEAKRVAETCGCARCQKIYKEWLEWAKMKEIEEEKRAQFDGNDDGPPDINSGGLADWYAKDL